ncbi:MAG: cohesin domain-containing protein [Clostridia bacterium]
MKKYIKITVISLIIALVSIANVYAAVETDVTATADKTEVKIGEMVIVSLSANCEAGIEGIDATLEYDETKLELQNLSVDAKFSNMSGINDSTGEYKLTVISNSADTLTSETFARLEFKVLDTALANEGLTVKLSEIEIGDSNDEWTTIGDKEVTITVIEDETDNSGTGNNNQEEDNNPGTGDNNQDEDNNNSETGNNNQDEDNNNSETGDNKQEGDNKNPETGNNNSGTNTQDNTQANKEIDYAGLEKYSFVIIAIISLVAVISYKKYQQYKNV